MFRPAGKQAGWLHAYRLTPEQANKARRKLHAKSKKSGATPQQQTLVLAEWVLVFSSTAKLSPQMIMDLYRLRWQVELVIKRYKSILDLDQLRSRFGRPLAPLWLHGKILYALMLERRAKRIFGDRFTRLDVDRSVTWWRLWKIVIDEVQPLITAAACWDKTRFPQALEVLSERPRCRKLKRISPTIVDLLSATEPSSLEVAA